MRLATAEELYAAVSMFYSRPFISNVPSPYQIIAIKDPCVFGANAMHECAVWPQRRGESLYVLADDWDQAMYRLLKQQETRS